MTLARAGSYVLTGGKVTGGTWTTDGAAGHGTDNDPVGGAYGVATGGAAKIGKGGAWLFGAGHGTASMGGAMTAVFTWDGPAGTEPPCVVVKETASADWGGNSGACDSGLSPQTTTPTTYGERKAAVVYTVIPNPPHVITRRCAPSGNASYTTDIPGYVAGGVSVSYAVEVTPVSIESNFALRSADTFNFLVGQEADFYVSAGGYQLDQHQWGSGAPHVDMVRMLGSDARETVRDNGQTLQPHPSWFYDGDDYQGQVSCSVRIKAGTTVIGTVSLNRILRVYRPIVDVTDGSVGPSTINDPAMGSQGTEEAMAGSRARGIAGAKFVGQMKLPPLFVQAQGLGQWSYVQLASNAYSASFIGGGSEQKSDPMGLDNVYPYGGLLTASGAKIDWCDTTYAYELNFVDNPSMGIGDCSSVSRSFSGKPFVVLRPPVYSGQGRVDMPIKKAGWSYAMNSSRNMALDWEQSSGYVFYPAASLYETTPYGAGVSLDSPMQNTTFSEDMDWHTVLSNP